MDARGSGGVLRLECSPPARYPASHSHHPDLLPRDVRFSAASPAASVVRPLPGSHGQHEVEDGMRRDWTGHRRSYWGESKAGSTTSALGRADLIDGSELMLRREPPEQTGRGVPSGACQRQSAPSELYRGLKDGFRDLTSVWKGIGSMRSSERSDSMTLGRLMIARRVLRWVDFSLPRRGSSHFSSQGHSHSSDLRSPTSLHHIDTLLLLIHLSMMVTPIYTLARWVFTEGLAEPEETSI